jgi:eukaryotic-like serine/threonine-protein kinase
MIQLPRDDENMQSLIGAMVPSEISAGVLYKPELMLGKGGGAIAFLAHRVSQEGKAPVVIKVLRPAFVRKLGATASLLIRKEAVALGRLNERVPPTPFVVRLIDTGVLKVLRLAIEYVHGGSLGTTLAQRVRRSLRDTGFAFDGTRAATAIDCIGQGLAAVHEVGVIHRDLTPNNVLCTGRGSGEVFKIADFGVARPSGVAGTLSGSLVGTPGFAAPELSTGDPIGTFTDVFSFASLVFFIFTGEPLFNSMAEIMRSLETGRRRSLLEMPGLHPELRKNEKACRSIDLVLGWAAAPRADARLGEALAVTSMILPHLAGSKRRELSYTSITPKAPAEGANLDPADWRFTVPHKTGSSLIVRSVAWDGHGRAIAATKVGLSFWNGTTWRVASTEGLKLAGGVRFVQRVGAGRWILGGDDGQIAIYTTGGEVEIVEGPRDAAKVESFGGDLEDISVLACSNHDGTISLNTYATKRWLRPRIVPGVASITSMSRFDDARWLVVGRRHVASREGGGAYAALYHALDWEIEELSVDPRCPALLASVARPRKSVGYAAGARGFLLTQDGETSSFEQVPGEPVLSAVALDPFGRPWVATAGSIFLRDDVRGWVPVWEDLAVEVPIVSLFLDTGLCIAMTVDGGIIEGRASVRSNTDLPPAPPAPG